MENTYRLYTDLAWMWPMWGDAAAEYAHYCRDVAGLIEQHAERPTSTLLDIGSGGGKNVLNLKGTFSVTGVDLRPTIRDHGHLRIETDHWTMGLFSLDTWRRVLRETGFEVHEGRYHAGEDEYTVFACVKTR